MLDSTNMSNPTTRSELLEKLEMFRRQFREFQQEVAPLATQAEFVPLVMTAEFEIWGRALVARVESSEQRLAERIGGTEQRRSAELAPCGGDPGADSSATGDP
jgi:hypothetical protein